MNRNLNTITRGRERPNYTLPFTLVYVLSRIVLQTRYYLHFNYKQKDQPSNIKKFNIYKEVFLIFFFTIQKRTELDVWQWGSVETWVLHLNQGNLLLNSPPTQQTKTREQLTYQLDFGVKNELTEGICDRLLLIKYGSDTILNYRENTL